MKIELLKQKIKKCKMYSKLKIISATLFILLCYFSSIGQQRIIDQEVVCISPSGEVVNGESLSLRFKMINHGPDHHISGDTSLYSVYSVVNDQKILAYTGPIFYSDNLDSGASIEYRDDYGIQFNVPDLSEPLYFQFCVYLFSRALLDNGDSLIMSYDDPDMANNTCCKDVTLLPNKSSYLENNSTENEGFYIYPNPANTSTNLYINGWKDLNLILTLTDLTGREVLRKEIELEPHDENRIRVNTENLETGAYFISLQGTSGKISKPLIIRR